MRFARSRRHRSNCGCGSIHEAADRRPKTGMSHRCQEAAWLRIGECKPGVRTILDRLSFVELCRFRRTKGIALPIIAPLSAFIGD
jgi:hypothetical protein